MKKNINISCNIIKLGFLLAIMAFPIQANAQLACALGAEASGLAQTSFMSIRSAANLITAEVDAHVIPANEVSKKLIEIELSRLEKSVIQNIKDLNRKIIDEGLKPLVGQIISSKMSSNIQYAKGEDASNLQKNEAVQEQMQYKAIMEYKPDTEGSRYATRAKFFRVGEKIVKNVTSSYADLFSSIGNNTKGSSSGLGLAIMIANRWRLYQDFCDPLDNKGLSGCKKPSSDDKTGLSVMPSKAIFASDTIDFANKPYMVEALKELSFNITSYKNASLIDKKSLNTTAGRDNLIKGREYLAKMDAVGSMMYSIVAERFPTPKVDSASGNNGNSIQELRNFLGASFPSSTPSYYEVRKSLIEELRWPKYYQNLLDGDNATDRKEIYLKAYSLMMLDSLIEKQERISNSYAIGSAIELSNVYNTGDSVISGSSIGGGE